MDTSSKATPRETQASPSSSPVSQWSPLRRTPPTGYTPYATDPPVLRNPYVWFNDTTRGDQVAVVMLIGPSNRQENTVSRIPDHTVTVNDEDYATSTARVRAARDKVLANPRAAAAHQALGEQIAERIENKRATLSEIRRAVGLTQKQLAETLGIEQGDLSKLERRQNLHLATLSRFIEATGGRLRITAVYGDTQVDLDVGQLVPPNSVPA